MPTMTEAMRHADLPAAGTIEKKIARELVLITEQYEELVEKIIDGKGDDKECIEDMIVRHLSCREPYEKRSGV